MKKRSLAREISLALAVKAAAIVALYLAFFAGPHRPHVTPQTMTAVISGPVPPSMR